SAGPKRAHPPKATSPSTPLPVPIGSGRHGKLHPCRPLPIVPGRGNLRLANQPLCFYTRLWPMSLETELLIRVKDGRFSHHRLRIWSICHRRPTSCHCPTLCRRRRRSSPPSRCPLA